MLHNVTQKGAFILFDVTLECTNKSSSRKVDGQSLWKHIENIFNMWFRIVVNHVGDQCSCIAHVQMITDAAFGISMDRQAKWQSQHADTYVYVQGYRSPNASDLYAEWMGVYYTE